MKSRKRASYCSSLKNPSASSNTARFRNRAESANETLVGAMKIKLDHLRGLFRSREEFPFLNGVLTCLHEQRMATNDTGAADFAVRRNDDFDLDLAGDVHAASKLGIGRRSLAFEDRKSTRLNSSHRT